jgi:hypothetical protein
MKALLTAVSAAAVMFALGAGSASAKSAPDDGLYSMYTVDPDGSSLDLSVCGDFGCEFGISQSFAHVCAILESVPHVVGTTMTRDIFILDKRNSNAEPMTLTIYHRVDTNDGGNRSLNITLTKTLTLDINGGANANCKMVENVKYVYFGTDLSAHTIQVDKKKLKASVAANGATTLLTADSRGYVSMSDTNWGGYKILDPRGVPVAGGGIAADQVGDQSATVFK